MTLDFAQALYFRELDRRFQLDSAPTTRVAAIGLIAGTFSFYGSRYTPEGAVLPWIFLASIAGAMIFGTLAIAWIVRCYAGYEWSYLANPQNLLDHYAQLKAFGVQHNL